MKSTRLTNTVNAGAESQESESLWRLNLRETQCHLITCLGTVGSGGNTRTYEEMAIAIRGFEEIEPWTPLGAVSPLLCLCHIFPMTHEIPDHHYDDGKVRCATMAN